MLKRSHHAFLFRDSFNLHLGSYSKFRMEFKHKIIQILNLNLLLNQIKT